MDLSGRRVAGEGSFVLRYGRTTLALGGGHATGFE